MSAPDKKLAMLLKVGGLDFDQRTQKPIARFPVLYGFVAIGGKPVNPFSSNRCEDQREFCGVYSSEAARIVVLSVMRPPELGTLLDIGLLRQANGLDVVVPLKLDRESLESKEFNSFSSCMSNLSNRERASQKR